MVYYVYEYSDPRDHIPFYIGKGKGKRANKHLWMAQRTVDGCPNYYDDSLKLKKIIELLELNLKPIIKIIYETSKEKDALKYEREMITKIGRYPNGPLLNKIDGGSGTTGYNHTLEAKQKMSEFRKGKAVTKHSEEWKQQLRDNNPGGKATSKPVIKSDLDGNIVERYRSRRETIKLTGMTSHTFSKYCKEDGKPLDGFIYRYE